MRDLDSDALTLIQRQLGYSGVGDPRTTFLDSELAQIFDVGSGVRRARADIATGGWWFGILENVHLGADDMVSNINPYSGLQGFSANTFPPSVDPQKFDIWIHGAVLKRTAGVGFLTATLTYLTLERAMAFGKDDGGTVVAPQAVAIPMAFFDDVINTGANIYGINAVSGQVYQRVNVRMPSQGFLQFESVSTNASTWQMSIILGLFPVGMGSDVAT